jgi:hypothetical protein
VGSRVDDDVAAAGERQRAKSTQETSPHPSHRRGALNKSQTLTPPSARVGTNPTSCARAR